MSTNLNDNPGCFSIIKNIFRNPFAKEKEEENPYASYSLRSSVFTQNELAFYHSLSQVVGNKFIIFSKVRISDIFKTQNKEYSKYLSALNKINSRHVDFLLCSPKTGKPILAIELDDKSHQRPDRVERDNFVNGLFEEKNLSLLRYPSNRNKHYNPKVIRDNILESFNFHQ